MGRFKVGDSYQTTRTYNLEQVREFANLSGDHNPIHIDPEFAKNSIFGEPIVHGIFVLSSISSILATEMPGPGTIYLGQDAKFLAPVFQDKEVRITLTISNIRGDKGIYTIQTVIQDHLSEKKLIDGEAVVMLKDN